MAAPSADPSTCPFVATTPGRPEYQIRQATAGRVTWRGISGRLYGASIELLIVCRAPSRAAYLLVSRDVSGRMLPLFAGLALSRAPTVNLARIRHRAAMLGASEVHLIDVAHSSGSYAVRRLVRDVRAGLAHAA